MFDTHKARLGNAFAASMAAHGAGLLLVLLVVSHMPAPGDASRESSPTPPTGIVWIVEPGPGGGGGGGGNRRPEPPAAAQLPGRERLTLPVRARAADEAKPAEMPAIPQVIVPAVQTASGLTQMPGVISPVPFASDSLGPGDGGGAGRGRGTGIGDGDGPGLGEGSHGGTGGGPVQPGNGVTNPRLIYETKPNYTPDAMRAKIQGEVWLEAVVMPDGSVGAVQVTRSLDTTFGLDQEAIRTVKQWRFAPGRLRGNPVPVRVAVELAFTLR